MRGAIEEGGVGRIFRHADGIGQRLLGPVARVGADEQHGADAEAHGGAGGDLVKRPAASTAAEPSVKTTGGSPAEKNFSRCCGQRGVAGVGIVEAEAGDERIGRPVFLFDAEDAGEKRQHQMGRVLGVEDGIGARRQAQFAAQVVDGLRPFAGDKAGQALDGAAHAGDDFVGARQPG